MKKHTVLNIPAGLSDHATMLMLAMRNEPPADDDTVLQRMRNVRYVLKPTLVAYLMNRRTPPTLSDLHTARDELRQKGLMEDDRLAA